ncbi:beta-L-arabinofuranosidase domain-containing protein [Lutibacter sp.]|uniref:beta-L-arabinofuranosidase domain-containing protein n=1 Tax=Lutibacter sp. TaxID=1925666 RepID=UPI001A319BEF|nr:beta-L-arabinofuranosidase domain-containing protein [Lutibacter sp.]MBI9042782.1 glycoside hydrolase family 127 protein [Lutibacter sp.]
MNQIFKIIILSLITLSCSEKSNISKKVNISTIHFGDIQPDGWMKTQMENDITNGFVSALDSLAPELVVEDDIYGKDRLTKEVKSKDVGAITDDNGEWEVQFLWWNSETQSNWWDGYIRNAILTKEPNALIKVKAYVDAKLKTQDEDGYLGVYAQDLRYNHKTENGELWAQSSLLRGLLAYYEYSKEIRLLNAIEKAVQLTMKSYPINNSQPFNIEKPFAGVGHGLTFVDVLNRLYELTNNKSYMDYAVFLYQDYDKYDLSEVDIQTKNLLNPAYKFKGHGVHTYEHLRALTMVATYTKEANYIVALEKYLERLEKVTTPSGGPIGDEWIFERTADADNTGYEYCSTHELLDSYSLLLKKTNVSKWADKMEWLLFNAAQGARNPDGKSIAYCKTDNSYFMQGAFEKKNMGKNNHNRFKYSPVHKEVAACCVPNAGRIYPYYVNSMWAKNDNGLVLNLFGPSEFNTLVNKHKLKITQKTNYPFDFKIELKMDIESPENFQIAIRKPTWAISYTCSSSADESENEQYLYLHKTWKTGDVITIQFKAEPKVKLDLLGDSFFSYGPLVFGLPIEGKEVIQKIYPYKDFKDLEYHSNASKETKWKIVDPTIIKLKINENEPLWNHFKMGTTFINSKNETELKELKPMGNLILRQVTFPKLENNEN